MNHPKNEHGEKSCPKNPYMILIIPFSFKLKVFFYKSYFFFTRTKSDIKNVDKKEKPNKGIISYFPKRSCSIYEEAILIIILKN